MRQAVNAPVAFGTKVNEFAKGLSPNSLKKVLVEAVTTPIGKKLSEVQAEQEKQGTVAAQTLDGVQEIDVRTKQIQKDTSLTVKLGLQNLQATTNLGEMLAKLVTSISEKQTQILLAEHASWHPRVRKRKREDQLEDL